METKEFDELLLVTRNEAINGLRRHKNDKDFSYLDLKSNIARLINNAVSIILWIENQIDLETNISYDNEIEEEQWEEELGTKITIWLRKFNLWEIDSEEIKTSILQTLDKVSILLED